MIPESRTHPLVPACWEWTGVPDPATWTLPPDLLAVAPELADCSDYCAGVMLREWQADRCAICGRRGLTLLQDHDHATGLVRGYLCTSCNTREGFSLGGGPIGRYRERNPANMLGLRIRYWDSFRREYAEPLPERTVDDWEDNAAAGLL